MLFMTKTKLSVRKAKYSHCASEKDLRAELISEGYYIFPWQDDPGAHYAPHQHRHDEFIVVQSGNMRFVVEGKELLLEKGDMLILPEGAQHEAFNDSQVPVRYFICSRH